MASHLSRSVRVWGSITRPCFAPRAATQVRCMGAHAGNPEDLQPIKVDIGKREVVGFGLSGDETYFDDVAAPFPAIRFKEDIGEIAVRKTKQKTKRRIWRRVSWFRCSSAPNFSPLF